MSAVAKNVSDPDAYTLFDHVFSRTLRSLSRVVGLRKVTQPFWNRWLASGVDERIIFRFLDRIGSMDALASVAADVAGEEIDSLRRRRSGLARPQEIGELRALSYLCNMAQWGCLPLIDSRRGLYALCRDFCLEAETLAYGDRFRRLDFALGGLTLHANLHVPDGSARPLVTIVHGIDGCKEEHLATELALLRAGFAVLGFDGPGQAEASSSAEARSSRRISSAHSREPDRGRSRVRCSSR
jgi:hypothetical protein